MRRRLVASIVATTVGLAFWWSLTEPLPVPLTILLGVPAAILFCAGLIAGRLGVLASPIAMYGQYATTSRITPRTRSIALMPTPAGPKKVTRA